VTTGEDKPDLVAGSIPLRRADAADLESQAFAVSVGRPLRQFAVDRDRLIGSSSPRYVVRATMCEAHLLSTDGNPRFNGGWRRQKPTRRPLQSAHRAFPLKLSF